MKRILINPFYLYSLVWSFTIILYLFKIINIFPKLSLDLLIFLIFSIIFSIFLGKNLKIKKIKINRTKEEDYIFVIILIGWILTFLYEGKIPLLEAINKTGYMYVDFKGIKTFSVIIWTLTTYHSIKSFIQYIVFKEWKYLFYIFIEILFLVLILRRGPILIIVVAFCLSYLFFKFKIKNLIFYFTFGTLLLYVFGILGNIRHGYSPLNTSMLKQIIYLNTEKSIFDPLLWGYTYITSPLSNLQYNISINNINFNLFNYITLNLLPDFISKRFNVINTVKLLIPNLTVGTIYDNSYITLGIIGIYTSCLFYFIFNYLYLKFLIKTEYFMIGTIILCLINIFSIFDNMYTFSGLSFCLVYPIFFIIFKKFLLLNSFKIIKR